MSRLLIEQSVRKIAQNTQRTIRKKSIPESKEKVLKPCGFRTFVAAGEGFEPSHTESESAVLPLHKPAIFAHSCRTNRYYYTGKQEFVKDFFEKNNICRFQPLLSNFPPENTCSACIIRSRSRYSASEIRRRVCFFFKFHPSPVPRSPLFHVILYFQARKRYGPGS